jgi:hypothetical protein
MSVALMAGAVYRFCREVGDFVERLADRSDLSLVWCGLLRSSRRPSTDFVERLADRSDLSLVWCRLQ